MANDYPQIPHQLREFVYSTIGMQGRRIMQPYRRPWGTHEFSTEKVANLC